MHPQRLALMFVSLALLSGCLREAPEEPKPERAGQPLSGAEFLARTAVTAAASATVQGDVVRAQQQAVYDDYRRAIKLADPARAVNREQAREVARRGESLRYRRAQCAEDRGHDRPPLRGAGAAG